MELDHVLIAVADLATAGREIEARYGLVSIEGGRHPGWGTANRIVPLGDAYLELVTVVDEAEAARSSFGSWVAEASPAFAKPLGWAVRTTSSTRWPSGSASSWPTALGRLERVESCAGG